MYNSTENLVNFEANTFWRKRFEKQMQTEHHLYSIFVMEFKYLSVQLGEKYSFGSRLKWLDWIQKMTGYFPTTNW